MDKIIIGRINEIINKAQKSLNKFVKGEVLELDYLAIFSRDVLEFEKLKKSAEPFGRIIDKSSFTTGVTFLLNEPIKTRLGKLSFLKIRKPDLTKPYSGAPDFKVKDYNSFKKKYLGRENFSLIVRKDYEMVELKGFNILIYFPNKCLSEDIK